MWRRFYSIWNVLLFLFSFISCAAAQDIVGKIDLESKMKSPPTVAGGGIAYKSSLANCPVFDWQFAASNGELYFITEIPIAFKRKRAENRKDDKFKTPYPLDHQTYQFTVESKNCRFVADARQQVYNDGKWNYVPIAKYPHPSLSNEGRHEDMFGYEHDNNELSYPKSKHQGAGSLDIGDGYISSGLRFERVSTVCLDIFGNFELDQDYLRFYFPTGLQPELNRFAIELLDTDNSQSRLYFSKGNCRYELTFKYFFLDSGVWNSRLIENKPRKYRPLIQRN